MRQFLIALPLALALFVGATPANAANLPLLDAGFSIVPTQCTSCPCGLGGALQFIQNLMNAAIAVGIIMFVFVTVYAGFLFIFTATNPEAHSQAKKLLSNAVIGFVIILAAWILVDFIMKILYDGSPNGFGPWNEILATDGSQCIEPQDITAIKGLPGVVGAVVNGGGSITGTSGGGSYGVAGAQCTVSNPACSVNTLTRLGLSNSQANVMSCIAMTESSGNPNIPPYNQTHPGSNSSACGTFQITQTTWNRTAAGACKNFSSCTNAVCNAQVAVQLVQKSAYSSWTCPGCNNKAQACVSKYGGT